MFQEADKLRAKATFTAQQSGQKPLARQGSKASTQEPGIPHVTSPPGCGQKLDNPHASSEAHTGTFTDGVGLYPTRTV